MHILNQIFTPALRRWHVALQWNVLYAAKGREVLLSYWFVVGLFVMYDKSTASPSQIEAIAFQYVQEKGRVASQSDIDSISYLQKQ